MTDDKKADVSRLMQLADDMASAASFNVPHGYDLFIQAKEVLRLAIVEIVSRIT